MIVQVLGGTRGLDVASTAVLVRAQAARMPVGRDLVGRVLDGMGRPIDGGPPLLPEAERDLNGLPVNPVARAHPAEFIETGISAIDGLHTLVRGQKLPVFSGYGLPGLELAARIAAEARACRGSDEGFVVVFAAIGVTDREAALPPQPLRRRRRARARPSSSSTAPTIRRPSGSPARAPRSPRPSTSRSSAASTCSSSSST